MTISPQRSHPAIGYHRSLPVSDPDSLVLEQVPSPVPGPHELLVEVRAVSVNPVDVKVRAAGDPGTFRVLGFDAAGVVAEVGSAVTGFAVGDEVYYAGAIDRPGSNQRQQLVDSRIVGHKPASVDFAAAASLPLTAITAWETLFDRLRLTADSTGTLLVIGASGGVGSVLLQLAEALLPGVHVIATASGVENRSWVRGLGAEEVVDHRGDLAAQVLALAPGGVDRIFTAHSAGQLDLYAQILRPFGEIVAIDDGPRDVAPLKGKSISWHWELMFTRPLFRTDDLHRQGELLDMVADLVDSGRLAATSTTTLTPISPDTLREAHRLVETGRTVGKVVVSGWE